MQHQDAISEVMDSQTGLCAGSMMQGNLFSIVHQIPDIIYKIDDQGRFVFLNNSIRKLGYEPKDLLDKHFSTIIHPDDIERVQLKKVTSPGNHAVKGETLKRGFFDERRTGSRITRDLTVRFQHGERIMLPEHEKNSRKKLNVISTGVYDYPVDGTGKIFSGTIGMIREVVRRDDVLEEFGGSSGLYRAIVENSGDVISILAGNGTILYCSPSVEKILGYVPESLVGEAIWKYIHEEDSTPVVERFINEYNGQPEFEYTCRVIDRNSSWRVIKNRGTILRDTRGKILCIVLFSSDFSAQHRVEESMKRTMEYLEQRVLIKTAELDRTKKQLSDEIKGRAAREEEFRERELCYQALVEKTDEIVIELDMNGSMIVVNPMLLKQTGFLAQEIVGGNIAEYIHMDDMPIVEKMLMDAGSQPAADSVIVIAERDIRMLRKDRSDLWIEARCRPVPCAMRKMRGYVIMAADVTRRKMIECDNNRIMTIDVLSAFAERIGRDLNNALASLLSNISLIRLNLREEDAAYEHASFAEVTATMVRDLAWRMFEISGGGASEMRRTNLADLIRETASATLDGSSIFLRFIVRGRIKKIIVNPTQIRQVINNIVLNSFHAMQGKGEIIITIDNYRSTMKDGGHLAPGDYIRVTVSDAGCGIAPENIDRIYDPFFTTKEDGNGLGLSVSYAIIKRYGGHMSVKSVMDKGTEVILHLPVTKSQASRRQKMKMKHIYEGSPDC